MEMGMFSDACARCSRLFHCPTHPGSKQEVFMTVAMVIMHLVYLGALLIFDKGFVYKFSTDPWYTAIYLLLFVATLAQYFVTSCTSPGYVLDAMTNASETDQLSRRSSIASKDWTCTNCNLVKPPRAKHCYDCDKCVLQFDHHCVWIGACIGQGNRCRFWWYVFEESALGTWTAILYILFLKSQLSKSWFFYVPIVILLALLSAPLILALLLLLFHSYLLMTNQTTYELLARNRIPYLMSPSERYSHLVREYAKICSTDAAYEAEYTWNPCQCRKNLKRSPDLIHAWMLFRAVAAVNFLEASAL